ncbi:TrbI/VirB10 family protein [Gloeothece verrucosa]|uniref:TrbI/VirB10 family protein n=1 Tax=Gloeothece verrucosa TaxID=2546359 RepID=UPI0002E54DEC|nr:TrbI/VirB10 family protein [Gloeothece verrucosa]
MGAVLEGGFEPLSDQIKKRNDSEIDELRDRERLWYLNPGTKVQIQVNRSLEL